MSQDVYSLSSCEMTALGQALHASQQDLETFDQMYSLHAAVTASPAAHLSSVLQVLAHVPARACHAWCSGSDAEARQAGHRRAGRAQQ